MDFIRRRSDFVPNGDAPVRSYLDYLASKFAFDGILGIKVLYNQLENFMKYSDLTKELTGAKIIYLHRQNVIKQAISLYIAEQTKTWANVGSNDTKPSAENVPDIEYNFTAISNAVRRIEQHNALLRRFFLLHDIQHMPLSYEDFVSDKDRSINNIFKYLELEPRKLNLEPESGFTKQSTALNSDFYRRFAHDTQLKYQSVEAYRGPPLFPATPPL